MSEEMKCSECKGPVEVFVIDDYNAETECEAGHKFQVSYNPELVDKPPFMGYTKVEGG